MADCFISYSSQDEAFATWLANELQAHRLTVFMAGSSLLPGDQWSKRIRDEVAASSWVVFLASQAACASSYVQQELGMALGSEKRLVPVVWDMPPSALPGWVNETQALDLRDADAWAVRARIAELAGRIRAEKETGYLIGGALLLALVAFGASRS